MTNPTKLGKYELDPIPIGQGAMGIVYKAFDPDLRQSVAIKVIRTQILEGPGEDNARLRFKNEAVAGRRLRHPNVVPVYDYGAIVAGIECAALGLKITPAREVVLSGYLKPEDRDRVEQEVARVSGVKGVLFMAETLAWPYCELRGLLGTYQSINSSRRNEHGHLSGVRLTPRRPDARYQEAERLVLTLTAPDLDSYLYVDYFLLDGSVLHLFPLTASEREPQQPSKDFALGQGDGKGARQWEVSPPFGREMLVAIAAQEPLFSTTRPEMDTSKEYLLALSRALEQARSRGSVVLADLVPITTTPATQQNEAAGP